MAAGIVPVPVGSQWWCCASAVLGRIMSIENIQNASERDDTSQASAGQARERSYDPYLTDNTGLLEA